MQEYQQVAFEPSICGIYSEFLTLYIDESFSICFGIRSGNTSIEHAYGITSLSHAEASPERLLSLNRGHWAIENKNHRRRDTAFREDACLMRTGHGPANNTAFSNLALAIILTAGFDRVPAATDHFEWHRDDALKHVLAKPPRKT